MPSLKRKPGDRGHSTRGFGTLSGPGPRRHEGACQPGATFACTGGPRGCRGRGGTRPWIPRDPPRLRASAADGRQAMLSSCSADIMPTYLPYKEAFRGTAGLLLPARSRKNDVGGTFWEGRSTTSEMYVRRWAENAFAAVDTLPQLGWDGYPPLHSGARGDRRAPPRLRHLGPTCERGVPTGEPPSLPLRP